MKLFLLLLLSAPTAYSGIFGTTYSVGARGHLDCNGKNATDVIVRLYDNKSWWFREMGESTVNAGGNFSVSGYKWRFFSRSTLEPILEIYHKCNKCYRSFAMEIPEEYITNGSAPIKFFDVGNMELSETEKNETMCL